MSEFPTIREEIERKAVDTAVWLLEKHEAGEMTDEQLFIGQQVLFMTISGLVGQEVFELISAEMPEMESGLKIDIEIVNLGVAQVNTVSLK